MPPFAEITPPLYFESHPTDVAAEARPCPQRGFRVSGCLFLPWKEPWRGRAAWTAGLLPPRRSVGLWLWAAAGITPSTRREGQCHPGPCARVCTCVRV